MSENEYQENLEDLPTEHRRDEAIPPDMTERHVLGPIYILATIYFISGGWPLANLAADPLAETKIRVAMANLGLFTTMWGLALSAAALTGGVGLFLRERWGRILIILYSLAIIPTRGYAIIRELAQSTAPVDTTGVAQNIIYVVFSILVLRYLVRPTTAENFHSSRTVDATE